MDVSHILTLQVSWHKMIRMEVLFVKAMLAEKKKRIDYGGRPEAKEVEVEAQDVNNHKAASNGHSQRELQI